jgi:hypothetical protein
MAWGARITGASPTACISAASPARRSATRNRKSGAALGKGARHDHVDAAIRIFDPGCDVEVIRQKIPSAAHRALRGDLTRATLDALRNASGPMTTKELARHVMAERGLNSADTALLQLFTRRTGALLRWQKKRSILRSVKDEKYGRFDLWEIAV